ncbi:FAD binding domain-containing protein [Xylariales sp. PMI_506]|nr:FAD binding domain-containing protein [Xylariales sp. PMI_506]
MEARATNLRPVDTDTLSMGSITSPHLATLSDVPVLVVGGGPSGLLLAYLLSKLGVKSLLIEKYPARLAAPKAHALSPRSFELCRQFGLDTGAMRRIGSPREDAYWVNFLTNLSGERIGLLPYERMDPEVLEHTPEMIHNIPQPDFEQFVANELKGDTNVKIRKGIAFLSAVHNGDSVTSTLQVRETGERIEVRSRYLVGCDGAKSEVRNFLGIDCEGEDSYETMMTIHFHADLRPVVKERVGMLHWITDPACFGFIIAYDLGGNQVLISNFDSRKYPVAAWDEKLSREVVSAAIGSDISFKIESYRPWILSRKVANQYSLGNIFLAGDAAHAFPPTGGLGLNTGIGDIAAVYQGSATPKLLLTYEAERRPVAMHNAAQSVKNGKAIFSFLRTLGTAGIDDVEEARANLQRSIHDPEKQEMIKQEVEGQREHFDNLEIHIGYVYGSEEMPAHASQYSPKFIRGARLPHAWITFTSPKIPKDFRPLDVSYIKEWSSEDVEARTTSILDLCDYQSFTLIVGSRNAWKHRFEELQHTLRHLTKIPVMIWAADSDFKFVFPNQAQLFERAIGLSDGGAVLVRPDQHILSILEPDAFIPDLMRALISHLGFD